MMMNRKERKIRRLSLYRKKPSIPVHPCSKRAVVSSLYSPQLGEVNRDEGLSDRCRQFLQTCRRAMNGRAALLVVEMPAHPESDFSPARALETPAAVSVPEALSV